MKAITFCLILLTTVCLSSCRSRAKVSPDSFFSAIDLQAIVDRSAPPGVTWEPKPGVENTAQRKFYMRFFKGSQADATTLRESLKREVSAEVTRAGGTPRISALPNESPGGYGFRLEYELGAVRGDVRVAIREDDKNPNASFPFAMAIALNQPAQDN